MSFLIVGLRRVILSRALILTFPRVYGLISSFIMILYVLLCCPLQHAYTKQHLTFIILSPSWGIYGIHCVRFCVPGEADTQA